MKEELDTELRGVWHSENQRVQGCTKGQKVSIGATVGVRFIPRLRWLVHTVLLISFTCYWNMQVGISKVAYTDLFSEGLILVCSIYPQPASTYVHCATACTCGLTFQVLSGKTLGMKCPSNM